jgi:hypothetical protein
MNCQVDMEQLLPGDTLLFKGNGPVFKFFSFLLSIFDSDWRKRAWKPWHMAIAWDKAYSGWYVLEATDKGVETNYYKEIDLRHNCRAYHWLDGLVTKEERQRFLDEHINKRYDVAFYFFTSLQYLALRVVEWTQKKFIPWHQFTISLPRVLNDRFCCWELAEAFDRFMGKPWCDKSRYPLITDLLKTVEGD